jgi:cysteinyl-tRNA synthetase
LQAAEKAFKRLWEAYQWLMKSNSPLQHKDVSDAALDQKIRTLLDEMDEFMNDDLNTAKVLANLFELATLINSLKDGHLPAGSIGTAALTAMQQQMKRYMEDIFGLQQEQELGGGKLDGVLQLLIDIRKDAKAKKDFVTSDKIREELSRLGVQLKDEKDGGVSYQLS